MNWDGPQTKTGRLPGTWCLLDRHNRIGMYLFRKRDWWQRSRAPDDVSGGSRGRYRLIRIANHMLNGAYQILFQKWFL